MPFDPSGLLTRLYSWVTDRDNGVKILAQRVDDETNGIVAAINQLTAGTVGFRGPLRTVNGTKGTPSFAFKDDPNTGVYRVSEDILGLTGGTSDLQIGPDTFAFNGHKVYHAGDRPTPAALGAPSLAGANEFSAVNTFLQRIEVDTTADAKLRLMGTAASVVEAFSAVAGQRVGVLTFDNTANLFRVYLDAGGGQPSARVELNRSGVLSVNGNAVYHAANKPTAADVIPSSVTTVGTFVFLRSAIAANAGDSIQGAQLTVAGLTSSGALAAGSTAQAGTWRAQGYCPAGGATLFVRIM